MVVGYVRLSRDDNRKDYVSIENQKLILTQYANDMGLSIERWYEDDGYSGYTFERPGFLQLFEDLEKDVTVILAKDLSRIGRHNARVLLFLENIKEMGKRVLLADDSYDSFQEEDEALGIKTWYNERYVKDTSRKIKKAMRAQQLEGTLALKPPMGYRRNPRDKSRLEIEGKGAAIIQRIFQLYLEGFGFRTIAEILDLEKVPTASMLEQEQSNAEGKHYKRRIAIHWSPKMVGEIIKNDIYIGNMRYHKNERITVHGKDIRVTDEEQYVFPDHHPSIIDKRTFQTAQKLLLNRKKGSADEERLPTLTDKSNDTRLTITMQNRTKAKGKYTGLLICNSCGSSLTRIQRKGREAYYLCGKYNSKGKQFCTQSIQIKEKDLDEIIINLRRFLIGYHPKQTCEIYRNILNENRRELEDRIALLESELAKEKYELKSVLLQNAVSASRNTRDQDTLEEVRNELVIEKTERIGYLKKQIDLWKEKLVDYSNNQSVPTMDNNNIDEMAIIDNLQKAMTESELTRQEISSLIDRIQISADGSVEIVLLDNCNDID